MTEEWTDWIDHDGKGCPCAGQIVEIERRDGEREGPFIAGSKGSREYEGNPWFDSWLHLPKGADITRYRIRKFKALADLRQIAKDAEKRPQYQPEGV